MLKLMLIAGCGGFLGTSCRFLINKFFLSFWKLPFPLATFLINISGCLLFGIIMGILQRNSIFSQRLNAFLIVGFCGGFTTFSTFSFETFTLGLNGEILLSALYIALSIIAGLVATWIGLYLTS